MSLKELAVSIASRNCALFAGSGLTRNSGGASWDELVKYIEKKFNYSSILTDNFDKMEDIQRLNNPEDVYNAVKMRLEGAQIPEDIIDLVKLPWFATFTTNYDLALERALREHQKLSIISLVTGNEFNLDGQVSDLACVKLMGSLDIPYREPGSMVLDKGDFAIAQDERSRIFDTLSRHAAKKSFLFFGYSFSDDLFFTILSKLSKYIGEPKNTFYALFLKKPDSKLEYKLRQNKVEIFIDTPQNFVKKLSHEASLRNPEDLTKKGILLGDEIIRVDTTKIGRFLSFYHPIFFEELEEHVEAKSFFYGNTSSFKPFNNKWNYQRKEIDEVAKTICSSASPKIISVLGYPGTGRTFIILAAINKLIRDRNSLAIRIPDYSINKIPESDDLDTYLDEIIKLAKIKNIIPERLVFFANFEMDLDNLRKFIKISEGCNLPIFLIFEDQTSRKELLSKFFTNHIIFVEVDRELIQTERGELEKYLLKVVKDHNFPEISLYQVHEIVSQEGQFLPIVYRTLDPAKRSINRIIEEDYQELAKKNPALKDCISCCAIPSYLGIPIPASVMWEGMENRLREKLTYYDVFDLIDESNRFIKTTQDIRGDYYFSIHHKIIAERLVRLNGMKITDGYLKSLSDSIDLRERIESDFFGALFIENGVNKIEERSGIFSREGLIDSFESIRRRQPARPVLHHLARLYEKANINDPRILPLLDVALREPTERYSLAERKEYILTTKAKIMWNRDRENLIKLSENDPSAP